MAATIPQQIMPVTGGILGAIRTVLLADPLVAQAVGQNISPGRVATGWSSQNASATTPMSAPYVILTDIGRNYHSWTIWNNQRIDIFDAQIQVTVFHSSDENGRQLSLYIHGVLMNQNLSYFNVNGFASTLRPSSEHELLTPARSELGADIWMMSRRYKVWIPEGLVSLNLGQQSNGNGSLVLPSMAGSGSASAT